LHERHDIYLTYVASIGSPHDTIWPQNDGTFTDLHSYYEYFVNGDFQTAESRNANVNFASSFAGFKSTFGANKCQITNSQNNALNRVNVVLPSSSKISNAKYNRSFIRLELNDDEWVEIENVQIISFKNNLKKGYLNK
jgi:hypothetical protein